MSSLTTQFNLKTDNSGLPGTIINSPLRLGDRFFVEILMENSDINPVGITSSSCTHRYIVLFSRFFHKIRKGWR